MFCHDNNVLWCQDNKLSGTLQSNLLEDSPDVVAVLLYYNRISGTISNSLTVYRNVSNKALAQHKLGESAVSYVGLQHASFSLNHFSGSPTAANCCLVDS